MIILIIWLSLLAAAAALAIAEVPMKLCGVSFNYVGYNCLIIWLLAIAFMPVSLAVNLFRAA